MSISECEPIALATGSEYTDFSRLLADRQYATLANAIVSVGFTRNRSRIGVSGLVFGYAAAA